MPISNFRDFGGYLSASGGRVVRDRLYRSGLIHGVSAPARAQLEDYDFDLIVDLRYRSEQEKEPSGWRAPFNARVLCHGSERIMDAPHLAILHSKATDPAVVETYFLDYYKALPFDKLYRTLYAQVLTSLSRLDGRLLIHCTAGKDRTGLLVALIHLILGVSDADMMSDFMLSAKVAGLDEMADAMVGPVSDEFGYPVPAALLRRLLGVRESYLHAALGTIATHSGSIDAYLDEMGVGPDIRDELRMRLIT